MKRFLPAFLWLVTFLTLAPRASADEPHFWTLVSPDHAQTFAYGSETNRVLSQWGRDKHLAVLLSFTNDPFVDRNNPREYDNFTFSFPSVRLGADGKTFYYHTSGGRSIPVAVKRSVFLGTEIKFLPNVELRVFKPHGYLTLMLAVENPAKR